MKDTFYVIYDRRKVLRMTHGKRPPSLKVGERFTAITIQAPDSLWAVATVVPEVVRVPEGKSVAPPVPLDLTTIPGVCFGKLLPTNDWLKRCVACEFTGRGEDSPHWKQGVKHD